MSNAHHPGAAPPTSQLKLVIANKNYSSWSMRPWVLMKAFDIPFQEISIQLDRADTSEQIARYSPAGRVPVLIDEETAIWDSLAICEYLAECYPEKAMWPSDRHARAMARSVCSEMHAGFPTLRSELPMNIRGQYPQREFSAMAQAEIRRLRTIWGSCLATNGYDRFLFGEFSIADAFFAPVVMRFRTYDVELDEPLLAYAARVAQHPAVVQWVQEALAEAERIPKYEVVSE
jgi:glutathione S-transferase